MKSALTLCSLALNPAAPSPTASMVKVEDGFATAFGGLFCIRVPVEQALGCCFNPAAAKTFFRKARKQVAYTVKKNKLILQDGKEKLSIGCLPPEEMVTLDVIAKARPISLSKQLVRYVAEVVDPANPRTALHGVTFREGALIGTDNKIFVMADVEFPEDLTFTLHKDACVALSKMKGEIETVSTDGHAVKFGFSDGSSLTTLRLVEDIPEVVDAVFGGKWHKLPLTESVIEDLITIDCHTFRFKDGALSYWSEDKASVGELGVKVPADLQAAIMQKGFSRILKNGGSISYADNQSRIRSVNENVCVVSTIWKD